MANHPVHFITDDGKLSPTAFIPFCEFGGNMSLMGVKMEPFHVPICNSFKAIIRNDQLCYTIDLLKFSYDDGSMEEKLNTGFAFLMDYNEDRQVEKLEFKSTGFWKKIRSALLNKDRGLVERRKSDSMKHQHAKIYLNTIGKL